MSDSPVIAFLNKATDLILLNFIWLLCCVPIVTAGAATTAMYYVCIVSIRQGDGYVVKRFFQSFRENFKKSTIIWICMFLVSALGVVDLLFWYQMGTTLGKVMFCVSGIIVMMIVMVSLYVFPVLAKLDGTIRSTLRNAAAFAIGYFPYTLIIMVLSVGFVFVNVKAVTANAVTLFIGFALLAYIKSFFFYQIFMKHIEEKWDDLIVDRFETEAEEETKEIV